MKHGSDERMSTPSRTQLLRELARKAETRGLVRQDDRRGGPTSRKERPGAALTGWEAEQRGHTRRRLAALYARVRSPVRLVTVTVLAFVVGTQLAARPEGARLSAMETEVERSRVSLKARQGELELVRLEVDRLQEIMDFSTHYSISADLAAAINDIALSEGIAPALAFQLVKVESGFYRRAVSPKGAVGYAQLMPATAYWLDPTLKYQDLFNRETNLRLGFRYLKQMLDKYDGDLRLALLAYNRGPGTVDSIRRVGGDPANGYARAVMSGAR